MLVVVLVVMVHGVDQIFQRNGLSRSTSDDYGIVGYVLGVIFQVVQTQHVVYVV